MLLLAAILVPIVGALVLGFGGRLSEAWARAVGTAIATVPLVLLAIAWVGFEPDGPTFQQVLEQAWIPSVGAGFRIGLDGMSLALASLTALLFPIAIAWPTELRGRGRQYVGWMLFLQSVCLGFFMALDLLLFYVFFDLSLVGMYFLIAIWGHADRERAALKFILFTFAGSLVMLLGILSLSLAADPMTFDLRVLMAQQPLAGDSMRAGLTFLALMFGLSVKTPLVPVHTWLPAAHVEAPAPVSAILAGILLKMGTYGMIRVVLSCMDATFGAFAPVVGVFAVISIVYGAFVAWGQDHIKRRIAYTSITHLGYTVLGIAAAASTGRQVARSLALTGANLEMVAHGLITGALFLITGSIWQRGQSFAIDGYGGLMSRAPKLTVAATVAAFASLGMPALAGFVAEFQIFSGTLAVYPWLAGFALVGVLVTAVLFLQLLRDVFFGEASARSEQMSDLKAVEIVGLCVLLGLTVAIGIAPAFILDILHPTSEVLTGGR